MEQCQMPRATTLLVHRPVAGHYGIHRRILTCGAGLDSTDCLGWWTTRSAAARGFSKANTAQPRRCVLAAAQFRCLPVVPGAAHPKATRCHLLPANQGLGQVRTAGASKAVDVARCAPVLEDTLLNNAALWLSDHLRHVLGTHDFLEALLPAKLHNFVHAHEMQAVLALREVLVALVALLLIIGAEPICRAFSWLWTTVFGQPDDDGAAATETFEAGGFAAAVRPLQFVVAACFVTRHLRVLIPFVKVKLQPVVIKLRWSAVALAATWFAVGWKSHLMGLLAASHPKNKPMLSTLSRFLSLFLRAAGLVLLLDIWGVAVRSILAVGGISGIAVGFAAKELFANFFGGLVLFATQPFVVGNNIKAGNVSGKVTDIGFLQTKLEGFDRYPVVVPNSMFLTAMITNLSRSSGRVLDATFDLRNEDIVRVRPITRRITAALLARPQVDPSASPAMAYLKALGPTSLQLGVSASLLPMSKREFLEFQQAVLEEATEIIMAEGAFFGASAPFRPVRPQHPTASLTSSTVAATTTQPPQDALPLLSGAALD